MKKFDVTIICKIRKTYRIEAKTEAEAIEEAQAVFSCLPEDDVPEKYDQDYVFCEEVKKTKAKAKEILRRKKAK